MATPTTSSLPSYQPLQGSEIRLLQIHPGTWDEPLSVGLHHAPLDKNPTYVALSYTWGDPTDLVAIELDGRPHKITRSLYSALRRLRWLTTELEDPSSYVVDGYAFPRAGDDGASAGNGLVVWADALCINQRDDREKEKQIPRMREIYSLCERVCVWLGENDEGECAVETGEEEEMVWRFADWLEDGAWPAMDEGAFLDGSGILALKKEMRTEFRGAMEAVHATARKLTMRAWFFRAWTIQEVILPPTQPIVLAGEIMFGFDRLGWASRALSEMDTNLTKYWQGNENITSLSFARMGKIASQDDKSPIPTTEREREHKFGRQFLKVLGRTTTATHYATMEHDYLYALLGLVGDAALPVSLAPNYTRPFPLVCQDYARVLLEATGDLSILVRHKADLYKHESTAQVPSWIPDFRAGQLADHWEGADSAMVSFTGSGEGEKLHIKGIDLGPIVGIYNPLTAYADKIDEDEVDKHKADEDKADVYDRFEMWNKFLQFVANVSEASYEDLVDNWLKRQIGNAWAWKKPPTLEHLRAVYSYCIWEAESLPGPESDVDDLARVTRAQLGASVHFVCESGAWGRFTTGECPRRGDHLVAAHGSRYGFLLHPVRGEEGMEYKFLGSCMSYKEERDEKYLVDFFQGKQLGDFVIA